ncbi:MAG: serine/threonine-protein phosphatase [Gammaproteobacteria bacterium]|nr:serine/threonine-protein phosphatase [Gammaproteobacteria bacterium]
MQYQLTQHTLAGARSENQDRIATVEKDHSVLMALADGLGGHKGGAQAAEALVQTVTKPFQKIPQPTIHDPSVFMVFSVLSAHRVINARARRMNKSQSGFTTCVVCLVQDGVAYWAHVGDSRLYHIRDGKLLNRTTDHTTTAQLIDDGIIDGNSSHTQKMKSKLLRCVGGAFRPEITLSPPTLLEEGDTLLLCSDGLWQPFDDEELCEKFKGSDINEVIEDLLIIAEKRMKKKCDNISVVALRWEEKTVTSPTLRSGSDKKIDQELLWQQIKERSRRKGRSKSNSSALAAGKKTSSNINSSSSRDAFLSQIEDLEAFVDSIDKQL